MAWAKLWRNNYGVGKKIERSFWKIESIPFVSSHGVKYVFVQ